MANVVSFVDTRSYGTRAGSRAGTATGGFLLMLEKLQRWQQNARTRRQLDSLTAQTLRDIGLTRADVESEIAKPFWRD